MYYKIVSADSTEILAQLVTELLHQGWTLVGGIAFDGNHYLQALTKS
ncbi:MAG TPA: DUF1737 domain-containing protein [Anaerolineales bacterium]|nr:DUF1737 domain-containing protein [Anaerolineales bacterium]